MAESSRGPSATRLVRLDDQEVVGLDSSPDLRLRGLWIGKPERPRYVRLNEVHAVQCRNHVLGALDGLGLGLLTGATIGALVGYAGAASSSPSQSFFTPGETASLTALGGGIVGGLLGTLIGGVAGHRFNYVF